MKKLLFFLPLLLIGFISCEDDSDDNTPPSSTNGSFEVTKNGVAYSGTNLNNTYIHTTQNGESGARLDLRCEIDGGNLILSVSNWDWQTPPDNGLILKKYNANLELSTENDCMDNNNMTYCDGALVTHQMIGASKSQISTKESNFDSYIKITGNNASDKTVTGEFKAILKDFWGNDSTHVEGNFTNLTYTVY